MTDMVKLLDRQSAVQAIHRLGEEDLFYLNQLIVQRINLIAQMRSASLMAGLYIGVRVGFTGSDGVRQSGCVTRLNKKTATVLTDAGQIWKVSPGLLEKREKS